MKRMSAVPAPSVSIPYGRQDISEADIAAVVEVLRSDWLTQGPAVPRFEQLLAARCGARHAVAVNSATSALQLVYRALGIGPGSRVWTSPNTFVATANAAALLGAEVDFIDIDPRTLNLCTQRLEERLEAAGRDGTLPDLLVPVHFAGRSCDMAAIGALAKRYGFRVVEDAAHALGAEADGVPVGACRHSEAVVLSFHPVKIVTTGEGGAVLCQDEALATRLQELRSHGITRDPARMPAEPEGAWQYDQLEPGWNFRMTDLQAALGASQLGRLDAFLARRRALAVRYEALLAALALQRPQRDARMRSAWHLYVVQLADAPLRRRVFDALRAAGIGVNVHYRPVYLQPWWRARGFAPGHCPEAERYYAGALSLPLHPRLSESEQNHVVMQLGEVLAGSS